METVTISCHDCAMRHSAACRDCVVTFVLDAHRPVEASRKGGPGHRGDLDDGGSGHRSRGRAAGLVVDADQQQALRLLAGAGLVPALRHTPRRTDAPPPR